MLFANAVSPSRIEFGGFPNDLIFNFIDFNRQREAKQLDRVVLGVLEFYAKPPAGRALETLPATTRLERDLGCNLQTIANTICMVESLFEFELPTEEISRIVTLEDLCAKVRHHVLTTRISDN